MRVQAFFCAAACGLLGGLGIGAFAAAPRIVSTASLDGRQVGVCFDQAVNAASANAATNYQLNGDAAVTSAVLQSDGRSVRLIASGLTGGSFVVAVSGVANLAGETASLSATGAVMGLTPTDIGGPTAPGVPFSCAAGTADLRAGGADIWGSSDSFSFLRMAREGDFDVRMQLARLDNVGVPGSHYTRAGLMVRESLAGSSRNLFTGTYPKNSAGDQWVATARLAASAATDVIPGTSFVARGAGFSFPNAWFRIRRTGNTFVCFYATNGVNWVPLGNPFVPSPPYPNRVFLGLAATSVDNTPGQTTFAQFRNLAGFDLTDHDPPTVVSVDTLDATTLLVQFSEPVDSASATNLVHYTLDGGAEVLRATVSGTRAVLLTTSPLRSRADYTLTVEGVSDRADPPNLIAPGSATTFTLVGLGEFVPRDVGEATPAGSTTAVAGGATVVGGGRDIGEREDEFHFSYQLRLGDFDVKTRLAGLEAMSSWAKAGLMARESLASGSVHASVLATPRLAGVFLASRLDTGGPTLLHGSFPVNYPATWVRLRRVGGQLSGFASLDGQLWTQLGSVPLELGDALYLGFAVTSRDTNQTATAEFRDFLDVTRPALATAPPPFEPLSASNRRGGLVISEILYHPQARSDGLDLEFVELFNSQVFFEDVGGYELAGDIAFKFPPGTRLGAGEFVVVAKDPAALRSVYGATNVVGPFTGGLPNGTGLVRLRNRAGAVLWEVHYGSRAPWPRAADGAGHALVLARPSHGENDVHAWAASDVIGGSPGHVESHGSEPARAAVINEFLANTDGPQRDFIELYNRNREPLDASGLYLTDDVATQKFRIPDGTVMPGGGFVSFEESALGFSLRASGETIYLVNSNRTRVLDAVDFAGQPAGVAAGRAPDGSPGFQPLLAASPAAPNQPPLESDLVINEILYHPISEDNNDEFVELLNRGTNRIRLDGWRFSDGIDWTFPTNTAVGPGEYLVVAKSVTNLLARYPYLTQGNVLGDFAGVLADGGERIALTRPEGAGANAFGVLVDEVSYGTGGRWSQWADGGGSSLELIDARNDNRPGSSWGASDESAKAEWTLVEQTGVLDHGGGVADSLQIQLLGAGECLVDNVEVLRGTNTANLVANATFEGGVSGWVFQGNHETSGLEAAEGFASARSLHVRALGRGDIYANRIRVPLTAAVASGSTATLRARVRWLRGTRELLLRFHGNYLEAAGRLNVPRNPGTPGALNTRAVANAGPVIQHVTHFPVLPAAGEAVAVTARVADADGLSGLQLNYRRDPEAQWRSVAMRDEGADGDAVAGDGLFSGIIPGQASGVLVAFYLEAGDEGSAPASTRFPREAPARECLVRFGEMQPPGMVASYRLWMTQATFNRWSTRYLLHNTDLDVTFVYGGSRAIHNVGARWKGSSWSVYDTPAGTLCGYRLTFPEDDRFLGVTDVTLDWPRGDDSGQAQQTAYWLAQQLDAPYNHRRFVNLFVNGVQRGTIYEDSQQPNSDVMEEFFPEASDGDLYKIEAWVEFAADVVREEFWEHAFLRNWTTTGGAKKVARYRWSFLKRALAGATAHDFTSVFRLVDTVNIQDPSLYTTQVEALVDVEEWMRVFAMEHLCGNWDSYSYRNGHNMYCYLPPGGRWNMLAFDIDFAFGVGSTETTSSLFEAQDPVIARMFSHPPFRRAYLRALQEAIDGPLSTAMSGPMLEAKFQGLTAHGIAVSPPAGIRSYMAARRSFAQSQLNNTNPGFAVNGTNSFSTNRNWVVLTGTAPLAVHTIRVNDVAYAVTWINPTTWRLNVPLQPGLNPLRVAGWDRLGNPISSASRLILVEYVGPDPVPSDYVLINEIMYHPSAPEAAYIELWNTSTQHRFDLSGWRLSGVDLTFPPGTLLTNGQFLVVAKNRAAFAAAYGAGVPVAVEFDGQLDRAGEPLRLLRPIGSPTQESLVDRVDYAAAAPWPTRAAGQGAGLQLIDAAQDNGRVANWSDGSAWRRVSVTGPASSSRLSLMIDSSGGDVFVDDLTFVAGSIPGVGFNHVVNGDFEAPLGLPWVIGPAGTNAVIATDTARSGAGSLHLVFKPGTPSAAAFYQDLLPIITNDVYTLSFSYLAGRAGSNLTLQISPSFRAVSPLKLATPGSSNNMTGTLPAFPLVWLNEVQPLNQAGPTDRAGEREPWLELHYSGSAPLSLAGFFLSKDFQRLTQWPFPDGATVAPGVFRIVFADGEPGEITDAEWHTNFRLDGAGAVVLSRLVEGEPQIVDYLAYPELGANRSFGAFPDGQLFDRREFLHGTPAAPNSVPPTPGAVFINEWMADNTRLADPADGDFEDWFELHNPGDTAVELGGLYLTDDLANPFQFEIPPGSRLAPHQYLLVWADNEPEQNATNRPELHVNFQLAKTGEAVGLFTADGTLVDSVTFGRQTNDVSQGRCPDGGAHVVFQHVATPGLGNLCSVAGASPRLVRPTRAVDGLISFGFETVPGTIYRVEYTDQLGDSVWAPFGGLRFGTGAEITIQDLLAAQGQRFYRVTVLE